MGNNTKAPESKVAISRKKIGGEVPMVVSEITDRCLYSGFFGTMDSSRMKIITDKLLGLLAATGLKRSSLISATLIL